MITSLFQKAKDIAKQIFVEDNSAHSIAMGLALGVFIGMLPIFGFQMIPAVAISIRLNINKLAAAAGVWITNPLTVIPIYLFNYWTGSKLLPSYLSINVDQFKHLLTSEQFNWQTFWNMGYVVLIPLGIGSFINASVLGIVVYFLFKLFIINWHKRMNKK